MKRNNILFFTISIFIALLFFTCTNKYQDQIATSHIDPLKDVFIEANKQIILQEENKIDSLLFFLELSFVKHITGIRILIDSVSNSRDTLFPTDGNDVVVAYNCTVFNDYETVLDNSLIDTLNFKIGYSKQMRGLNYAIKLLKVGDKAKIIIPSYLGFGMSGYGKTVPPYSTLFLNVKLLNVKE